MSGTDVVRKKIDNDDGTLTLVFYQGAAEVARTIVDKNYEIIDLQGTIPDGLVKQFYDSGSLFTEAWYKSNRREGLTRIYREDGSLWIEIPFKDDKAEGISKEYYTGGSLFKSTSFRNGKLDGRSCEFYESGTLKVEWNALAGKPEGTYREYYANGALKEEWENVNGRPEGQTKEYSENGQLKAAGNCISGEREGLYREYYETGVIRGEWSYREGKKEGIAREYFESGEIKYLDTYRRDQRVNRKAYLEYEGHEKSTQEQNDCKEIKEILVSQMESYMHYQNQILERIRLVEKRVKELEASIGDMKDMLKGPSLMKIYLAGPLFTQAERDWLQSLKAQILKRWPAGLEVCWPGSLFGPEELAGWGDRAKKEIFARCRSELDTADAVVALLDGTQVDDGTAWELGYFYARRKPGQPIIGIRTDFRKAGDTANAVVNLMIDSSCDALVTTVDGLLAELAKLAR